jgi:hypothetical protein
VAEEATEEVVEAPAEEVAEETTEVVVETTTQEVTAPPVSPKKKFNVGTILGSIALVIAVLAVGLWFGGRNSVTTPSDSAGNSNGAVVEDSTGDLNDGDVEANFDIQAFTNGAVNIAKQYTVDESIDANVDILVKNIGEDKLVEFIGKYGELNVQKGLAELVTFAPDVKMNQYISNNALDYNPNAADEYSDMLLKATEAYKAETGKNPDGALMSLDGYDTHKFNREAIKQLIIDSGDTALLTWYEAKTSGYDLMVKQNKDTAKAEEYRETVKAEILNSQGTADLLALQLEQEANGTLIAVDNASMQYTEDYNNFIINNYMYVIANK